MTTLSIDIETLLKKFTPESETEIHRVEATSQIASTLSLASVLLANAPGCSSAIFHGLSQQLIYQMNLLSPNILVSFDDLNVQLDPAALPFLQPAAKESLRKVIADRRQPIKVRAAYRTIAQQLFLYNRRNGVGGCNLTTVVLPGRSHHQSGIALDIDDYQAWRPYLESYGWRWMGASIKNAPGLFNYVGGTVLDIRATAVKAFQQLWNQNNPGDKIAEDGQWGKQTHGRLDKSPVCGFEISPWAANPRTLRLSRPAMQGTDVHKLQQLLVAQGENITPDSAFGSVTEAALKRVQKKLGLTPDGVAGPQTWAKVLPQRGATNVTKQNKTIASDMAATTRPPALEAGVPAQAEAVRITLKQGQLSLEVLEMQTLLASKGFYKKEFDGDFGPTTKTAVEDFQRQARLNVDGVAWPETLSALGYAYTASPRAIDTGLFTVDFVTKLFFDAPRRNIEKYLPPVLRALEENGLGDRDMVLMALGTIRAETAGFEPISEHQSKHNTKPGGLPFGLYDTRSQLGNSAVGDGEKYKGRGFVQLTGKHNYRKFGAQLNLGNDLLNEPELANEPQNAARILALFLKSKEVPIRIALARKNYEKARRWVNGGSHGLQSFTDTLKAGLALLTSSPT